MNHDSSFAPPSTTVVDRLRYRAEHQSSRRAFIFLVDGENEEVTLTYAELDRQARAIAARLIALGLSGERALLLYPPGLEYVAAFFGCLYAGVTAVPAYPPRRNRNMHRIQAIADDAQAKIALTVQESLDRVEGMLDETPHLKKLHWLATDSVPITLADRWKLPDISEETLALFQYTSGSTGSPKGVMLTHANLMHNSALITYGFEMTRSCHGVFWMPMYHDMGLIGGILQPMYVGQPNVLMSPMAFLQKPYRWLRAISRYGAQISGGPNFAYDLCVRKVTPEQRAKLDLSHWQLAFNGAEQVRAETIEAFSRTFAPCGFRKEAFYPCYGMAEATLIITGGLKSEPPVIHAVDGEALGQNQVVDAEPDEPGSRTLVGCGGIMPDEEILIVEPEKRLALPNNRVGEVWVRSPSVAKGYWNNPEATQEIFGARLSDHADKGPYLRTGDLGFFRDGELFITGRLKDLIIIRGVNRYPLDIEMTVERADERMKHGASAAATFERDGQERLLVVAEVERTHEKDFNDVFEAIRRDVFSEHEVPVDAIALIRVGTIPKTSSGKIQRHACRRDYLSDDLSLVAKWSIWDEKPQSSVRPRRRTNLEAASDELYTEASRGGTAAEQGKTVDRAESAYAVEPPQLNPRTVEIVLEEVRAIAKDRAKGMTLESNIVEMGLDSLERMEIVAAIEERFGGRFPDEVLSQIETNREVVMAVQQYLGDEPKQRKQFITGDEVPEEFYSFDKLPEYRALKQQMEMLKAVGGSNPYFNVHERITNDTTMIGGRELINFSSYNYLGMSGDPAVMQASKEAIDRYGTSVSASRVASGEKPLHGDLEQGIADFIGVEKSIVYVGGHTTNESTIGHIVGKDDLILHDGLAHNSIVQGCIMSGARRRPFPHNNWQTLATLLADLRKDYRRVLIAIEGVYSMDGDYPDLPRFIELAKQYKAWLLVDEAHSIGTMGKSGRGISEHFGINPRDVDLWMGTLSKSFGSCGGYIAGCKELVEYLKYTAPGFVYSVGISPSNAAAALASLNVLKQEPQRVVKCHANARLFLKLAKDRGLNTGTSADTPVIPIITGNSLHALILSRRMFERGVNVQPIMHPAVEESAARLRFFITSLHTEQQIRFTVETLAEELHRIAAGDPLAPGVRSTGSGAATKGSNGNGASSVGPTSTIGKPKAK